MIVKKLIELLSICNPEAEVFMEDTYDEKVYTSTGILY